MRRDGDDGDLALLGPVAPKNTVSAGRAVLNAGFEDFRIRIVGVLDGAVFVSIEARVARVCLQEANALHDLFEETLLRRGDEVVLRRVPKNLSAAFDLLTALPDDFMAEERTDAPPQSREGL